MRLHLVDEPPPREGRPGDADELVAVFSDVAQFTRERINRATLTTWQRVECLRYVEDLEARVAGVSQATRANPQRVFVSSHYDSAQA